MSEWQQHFDACPICKEAASYREACAEGRALHEAEVLAANKLYYHQRGLPLPAELAKK